MPYGVVLEDERRTSNIERPTSNEKTNIQYRIFNDYFYFFSAVLILVTKILINSSVSSFSIQNSMLDVRCFRVELGGRPPRAPTDPYERD